MKKGKYKVYFINGEILTVSAFSVDEAIILSQAEQIKNGHNYTVTCTKEIKPYQTH